eukprot:SAG31_NODE_1561_length_7872_cov_2.787469_9_plen_84_part_00
MCPFPFIQAGTCTYWMPGAAALLSGPAAAPNASSTGLNSGLARAHADSGAATAQLAQALVVVIMEGEIDDQVPARPGLEDLSR